MTIGQRIAQKRKELGLSQEALGEQLGVSRQAIYKWESDAAMPEVEKLINLSHIFSVSVGWILGVEDEVAAPTPENETNQAELVEEVLRRYQESQPAPVRRRVWPFVLAGVVLVVVFISLFNRLSTLQQNYINLQNSISRIDQNVQRDVNGIASRVEEILKRQNNLTAEFSSEVTAYSLPDYTVTFAVSAVPKTYVPGMTARFVVRSGEETVQAEGVLSEHNAYTAEVICPLSDDITISVVFSVEDKEETQILDRYTWLTESIRPYVDVSSNMFGYDAADRDGYLTHTKTYVTVYTWDWREDLYGGAPRPQSIRLGLFGDQKLLAWYDEVAIDPDMPESVEPFYQFELNEKILLDPDVTYCVVAFIVDQYGQEIVAPEANYRYDKEKNLLDGVDSCFTDEIQWITE